MHAVLGTVPQRDGRTNGNGKTI